MRTVFRTFLVICILGLSWFQFVQHRSFYELRQRLADTFDSRPTRQILILGNSRTYSNSMPQMLRKIADSAGSAQKYQITLQAPAGSSLELLWNDGYTQALLQQTWDSAIVQAESRAFSSTGLIRSFETFGPKLLGAIRLTAGKPDLVVNWSYDSTAQYPFTERQREDYQREINLGHALLAQQANAHEVKLSTVWDDIRQNHPEIVLTVDGNHPTLAGSYLFALLLYEDLSNDGVYKASFVPDGLSHETAAIMKDAVERYSISAWDYRGTLALSGVTGDQELGQ